MSDRSELAELRRMDELERRAALHPAPSSPAVPKDEGTGPLGGSRTLDGLAGLGELALQGVSGLGTLGIKGVTGAAGIAERGRKGMGETAAEIEAAPDVTYQPRTASGKELNKVIGKGMEGLHALATDRAVEGPLPIQGRGSMAPPKAGAESTAGSDAAGAILDLAPQAAAMVGPARVLGRTLGAGVKAPLSYFSSTAQTAKVLRRAAGTPEQRAAQAAALRSASQPDAMGGPVPNSGPTAAQAVADIPEGTTIQGLQRSVSGTPDKGVSVDFARRLAGQRQLLDQAKSDREAVTAPVRDRALAAASQTGGIDAAALRQSIATQAGSATVRGSPLAQRVISATNKFIEENTDAHGKVDPAAAYEFRKNGIGHIVSEAAGQDLESAKWAKVHVARGVQQAIDHGITQAGGTEWGSYLKDFSDRSKPIDSLETSLEEMYKPEQQTAIGDSAQMKDPVQAPHILSTKAVIANYGLGLRRSIMGKAVNRQVANALLDPAKLADILAPVKPGLSKVFRDGAPAVAAGPRFGPHIDLEPPAGRAFAEHERPLNRLGEEGVPQAESSQNPRTSLKLTMAKGRAFSSNQPSVLRSGEEIPLAESTNNPRTSLSLQPSEGTAFEPHNEAVTSSRSTDGPRTAPQWELQIPKPHYKAAEVMALIKKLREQE